MENNEIMNNNEEVIETTTEEIVKAASNGGMKKATTIGLAMIAGALTYKFVVVPATAKFKNWRENRKTVVTQPKGDIVSGEFIDKPDFAQYNKIVVPEDEAYGANCIWVNGTVIVAEGYPTVLKAVQDLGYKTLVVDTSEYRKVDGGLSCLSLRF